MSCAKRRSARLRALETSANLNGMLLICTRAKAVSLHRYVQCVYVYINTFWCLSIFISIDIYVRMFDIIH